MQDEALRPLVAVLRHAENALVREMTVQVVSQAIATNPNGLGSGALRLPTMIITSQCASQLWAGRDCSTAWSLEVPAAWWTQL